MRVPVLFGLGGASKSTTFATPFLEGLAELVADVPEELRLRVGEENTLRLPGLATAGYRWEATMEDEGVATVSSRFDSGETTGHARTASSRDELVTVSGRAEGTTRLSLVQRRSWEGGGDPIARHEVVVTVVAAAQQPSSEGRKT